MIRDVNVQITYRENGATNTITMTVTGKQIEQTIHRRMGTVMPTAKVIDLTEVPTDSIQLDATTRKPK